MSLVDDVNATAHLEGALCHGLGALTQSDRLHISKKNSTKLLGSVHIEKALKPTQPQAHTWDYLVGVRAGSNAHLHWIEVHPASSTGNIAEVASKLDWLKNWMETCPLKKYPRSIVWVASGKSAFNSRNLGLKKLASRGLRFTGSHLAL